MPNWKTHLEIAKHLNNKLNYNIEEYNMFLLGNILPDINNCYIVENISKKLKHEDTHFSDLQGHITFYNKYKDEIKNNPIILGYFVHLYTDYFWNNDFYEKVKSTSLNEISPEQKRIMKQKDFKIYNDKHEFEGLNFNDLEKVLDKIKLIKEVDITKEDLIKVINFLDNLKVDTSLKLNFYNMEQLDKLLNETVDNVIDFLSIN